MATPCDSASLIASAACYECQIPPGMQMPVLIWLMCQIANGSTGGGGNTSGIQGAYANYGGSAPNWTPTGTNLGIAVDTSTNRPWWYYNGQWN